MSRMFSDEALLKIRRKTLVDYLHGIEDDNDRLHREVLAERARAEAAELRAGKQEKLLQALGVEGM